MFKIISDSACDFELECAERYDVSIVPLYVTFDGVTYLREHYDLSHDDFYKKMIEDKAFPKSSLPSVQDYVDALTPWVEKGMPILVTTISGAFSGSYNSACTAKDIILEDYPEAQIEIVNSMCNSASFAVFLYQAIQMRDNNYSLSDTVKVLEKIKQEARVIFTTESLEYLNKGGRLAKTAITITTKLNLRAIIVMKDGEAGLGGFTRTRNKGKANVIEMAEKYIKSKNYSLDDWDITVGYCVNPEEAAEFRAALEEQLGTKTLENKVDFDTRINNVTGCHSGPFALGMACIPKYTTVKL